MCICCLILFVWQKLSDCTKRVYKSIELHEINSRIEEISEIAKEVNKIAIITKNDSVINDKNIQVLLNKTSIDNAINNFGVVSGAVETPTLISLKNTKASVITVEWKLGSKKVSLHNNSKLKIEWTETKSDDVEQFDEKFDYNKEIDLKNSILLPVNVSVDKISNYFVRIQYFDGKSWSSASNIKYLSGRKTQVGMGPAVRWRQYES